MNKWARHHEKCIVCNRVDRKHMAKGKCVYCYSLAYHQSHEVYCKELKHKHYLLKQKDSAKIQREDKWFDGKREEILLRDNHCCQRCGDAGDIVHHKDGNGRGSTFPNNELTNLETLCRACHLNIHRMDLLAGRYKKGVDRWASKYDSCIICNTTSRSHNSGGLCVNCYAKERRNKNMI